jgi:glutamyl-tRNA synthetase
MTVRVRFAPSPSGYLHIGGARTALFNWLWARNQGGKFIVRVEDTDQERSSLDSVRAILDGLKWMGLDWDEGPEVGGDHGPYFQSERKDIYRQHVEQLISGGHAYRCYCTKEELDAERARLKAENPKAQFVYPGTCRNRTDEPDGRHVVRFKSPREGATAFVDRVFGEISTPNASQQDFVLVRPDGMPLYNLAAVVDDHLMDMTLVARGRDHIGNTPQQILLYRAFGWEHPEFAHLPMMLSSKGAKISKRDAAVGVQDYQALGYTAPGVVNYLVRFGWSLGDQEIFTMQQLVDSFSWDRCSKSDGKFDPKKFADVAFEHLKNPELTPEDLYKELVKPALAERGLTDIPQATLDAAVPLIRERAPTVIDAAAALDYFFRDEPEFEAKAQRKFLTPETVDALQKLLELYEAAQDWSAEGLEQAMRDYIEKHDVKMKVLAQPARVAVTGRSASPPLFDVMAVLGQDVCLARLRRAIEVARQPPPA